MKSLLLFLFSLASCLHVCAQDEKTIVGKWKIVKATIDGVVFDAENREKTRIEMAKHMEIETGEKPDSMSVEAAVDELAYGLGTMVFEFTANRESILHTMDEDGKPEKKVSTFTLDLNKGIMIVESNRNGQYKKRTIKVKMVDGIFSMTADPADTDGSEMDFDLRRIQ